MKALKIFILLLTLSLSQAEATGFTHNMLAAQKMLKSKKEIFVPAKASKAVTPSFRQVEVVTNPKETIEADNSVAEDNSQISGKVATTISQWLSSVILRLLGLGIGR